MVRGSAIRVTGLTRTGGIPDPIPYAVSKSVVSVTINEVTESGGNEFLRNDQDSPRLHFVTSDETIRHKVDISFIRVDPGVLSLVSGVPVVMNAAGDVAGFDSTTRLAAASFALEVWSRLASTGCPTRYGYTLFPFLKGGVLSGFSFSNGLVSFGLQGATTRRSPKWGIGPYDIDGAGVRLLTPVSRNTSWRTTIVSAAPPTQVDGIQQTRDVVEGGTASLTTDDVVDGQSIETSSDVIEGGSAA